MPLALTSAGNLRGIIAVALACLSTCVSRSLGLGSGVPGSVGGPSVIGQKGTAIGSGTGENKGRRLSGGIGFNSGSFNGAGVNFLSVQGARQPSAPGESNHIYNIYIYMCVCVSHVVL